MKKKPPVIATCLSIFALGAAALPIAHAKDPNTDTATRDTITFIFPKEMFQGTPAPVKRANLEDAENYVPHKSVTVPAGTKNLAKDKPVTSSDDFPIIGELAMVTDGDKDAADGSFVELAPEKQWVQIDLGKSADIEFVMVWHYHKNARAYDDVVVQISDDPEFQKGVKTLFNNDHDNSSGLGKGSDPAYIDKNHGRLIDASGSSGRFVRLYSAGNTANALNHYIEVEVWGK
ncbi:MAG: hypothetical protein AAGA58_18755 [Verrucomicrobiota bacterium]